MGGVSPTSGPCSVAISVSGEGCCFALVFFGDAEGDGEAASSAAAFFLVVVLVVLNAAGDDQLIQGSRVVNGLPVLDFLLVDETE